MEKHVNPFFLRHMTSLSFFLFPSFLSPTPQKCFAPLMCNNQFSSIDRHSLSMTFKPLWSSFVVPSTLSSSPLSHIHIKEQQEKKNMGKDRTIGVALDFSKSSKNALKWALENLADKGDTIYVIHISHDSLDESRNQLWAKSGSRKYYYDSSS